MEMALQEAVKGAGKDEIPVGAVVVYRGEVIGWGYNRREELQSPMAHAEIVALEEAARHLGSWHLNECTLYVTLEPCLMCVGALLQARVSRLVFGCLDPKAGAVESLYHLCEDPRLPHRVNVTRSILAQGCAQILEAFFARLRKKKRSVLSDQERAISRNKQSALSLQQSAKMQKSKRSFAES